MNNEEEIKEYIEDLKNPKKSEESIGDVIRKNLESTKMSLGEKITHNLISGKKMDTKEKNNTENISTLKKLRIFLENQGSKDIITEIDKKASVIEKYEDEFIKLVKQMPYFTENYKSPLAKKIADHFNSKLLESGSLDDKVDNFINWYTENMVKGQYTDTGEYHKPREVRNLIEKMAVWYELRYPEPEIDKIFQPNKEIQVDINEEIFINNSVTEDLINESGDWGKWSKLVLSMLEWTEFYNMDIFLKSLSEIERTYLRDVSYNPYVRLHLTNSEDVKISLNPDGYIIDVDNIINICPLNGHEDIFSEDLIGMKIEDLAILLEKRYNCSEEQLESIKREIKEVNNYKTFKEGLLDSVMYRIIERSGCTYGGKRAFLFAKEFNRNIDIPMQYGYCIEHHGIKELINMYLENGGNEELVCYSNYQTRIDKNEPLKGYKVKELLK